MTITMHEMKYIRIKLEYACSLKNYSLTEEWYMVFG